MHELSRFLFLMVVITLSTGFIGCKDKCEDVECFNGAKCEAGICNCPDGYAGVTCEINLCNIIDCNNGTCEGGICVCVNGYTGLYCDEQVIPTSMQITRIDVFMLYSLDYDPEPGSNGDIYLTISTNEFNDPEPDLYDFSDSFILNASSNHRHTFTPTSPIFISDPTQKIYVNLYDEDSPADDL